MSEEERNRWETMIKNIREIREGFEEMSETLEKYSEEDNNGN